MEPYTLSCQLLLQDELALVQPTESVDLVLVLSSDFDLVGSLFVGLGKLEAVSDGVGAGTRASWATTHHAALHY